ncbi:conserved hypothetical protein [Xenorhabdus szentirmaii DSM 16338]|uniref:Uncharacterized protein n=1 Tax=Xenorhabdus szentirmaii DSM 16338 TaxID=1427518 RepID=W1J076_9GAMM|nr:conserved hypothetical protein [Xenorhabdus szentirmaii DSM 16338]
MISQADHQVFCYFHDNSYIPEGKPREGKFFYSQKMRLIVTEFYVPVPSDGKIYPQFIVEILIYCGVKIPMTCSCSLT